MRLWGDIPDWVYDSSRALMQSLSVVDPLTHAHCLRVGDAAARLAQDAGLNDYEQRLAQFAGFFHDIGKIGIPQEIIAKPGKLDPKEYDIMKSHPVISEEIVRPLASVEFFRHMLPAIRGHHERMDGQGYPDGKSGEDIPILARIILIVDPYDAMSETRAYRRGLPDEVVYAELKRCAGTQFDPQLGKVFLEAHPRWKKSGEKSEEAQIVTFPSLRRAG
ncbi:MAG: HD-GYP domain-containing protein [Bdellovibrionaceae bacterium]|nr:HD-GYP domain-containing protein [Pseudobdellovibrionaceae bacterium]